MKLDLSLTSAEQKDLEERFRKEFVARWQNEAKQHVNIAFGKTHGFYSQYDKADPNFGKMTEHLNQIVAKYFEAVDLEEKVKSFLERNFDKYLEEAMDEALRHQARRLAFSQIKEQAPREHKE